MVRSQRLCVIPEVSAGRGPSDLLLFRKCCRQVRNKVVTVGVW